MWFVFVACAPEESTPADTGLVTAPFDLSEWVAAGEGVWVGQATQTPLGDLDFGIEMVTQPDGALRGAVDNGYGFTLDFHYKTRPDGAWVLTETGTLPGGFVQSHTLEPVLVDGEVVEWVTPEDPGYLKVVAEHTGDTFVMETSVRGEIHAVFDLARVAR